MTRVGLVGAGRVAGIHAAGFAAQPGVAVVAVADPRIDAAEALAASYGATAYAGHAELISRSDVDVVAIAIPHDQHRVVAEEAVRAGKHVFLDKPLAASLAEAEALAAVVNGNDKRFMVSHNLLFHPAVERARALLREHRLGRLTTSRAWSRGWLELAPWDFRRSREQTGGGVWLDCASHLLYVLEDLVGPIDDVLALPVRGETRLGGEDAAAGILRFAGGSTATLEISYSDWRPADGRDWPGGWAAGYHLVGTQGELVVEVLPAARVRLRTDDAAVDEEVPGCFEQSFGRAIEHFVCCVTTGETPRVTAADALRIFALIENGFRP